MKPRTQPLRDEHRALLPELAMLRVAADAIGTHAAIEHTERAYRLLARHLLPHMDAEETVLYPAMNRVAGHDATATLLRDHDEIRRYAALIEAAIDDPEGHSDNDVRAVLYGLDAIVHLHLTNEESLYPLLDVGLDDEAALAIITGMRQAKHRNDTNLGVVR